MLIGMTDHWISAHAALALVATQTESKHLAQIAICTRAHLGVLRSKAAAITSGNDILQIREVPSKFWWAEGYEALEQNWNIGDFSTWIDKRIELKAFGVSFEMDGILEMLPVERRGRAARDLSVSGNPDWVSAHEARRMAFGPSDMQSVGAEQVLIDQARLGFLPARAVLMQVAQGDNPDEEANEQREWDIPVSFWISLLADNDSWQDWTRGGFAGRSQSPFRHRRITLTGVYFSRDAVEAAFRPTARPDAPAEPKPAAGGRPPAAYWDEMWCAICGRIYRGELQPKRQADVENAMLDWLAARGHEPSSSTVRPRARQLFAELQKEGENPAAS